MSTAELVAALDSPSGWQRDLAQMMLIWKQDKSAVPLLERLVTQSRNPLARLHALCTLDGLNTLGDINPTNLVLLKQAQTDSEPGVRRHGVRLSNVLTTTLMNRAGEDEHDPRVRLELAYTLGRWDDDGHILGTMAVNDANDRFVSAAVMSSITKKNLSDVLLTVLKSEKPKPAALV